MLSVLHRLGTAGLALALVFGAAAVAEETVSATAEKAETTPVFDLGVVEVIAKRPLATSTVEKIDATTLREYHRDDLSTALDLLPGVAIQNVGQRRERLISVRGFSSRQVPLFIDGVPVYVPYDGNVDLSRFGVDYVSEIVVSKGLASLLYGPNVLGGAINVISRRPTQPFETSLRYTSETGDSDGTLQTRVVGSIGGIQGNWYGHATASYVNAEGYSLPDSFKPTVNEDGGTRNNSDSRDLVVSAKLGYVTDSGDEYALSYYRQDGDKNVPPYAGRSAGVQARFWRWPYWDKQSFYFTARNELGSQATVRWRAYYDQFKNALDSYDDATYTTFRRPYAFKGSEYDDYTIGGNGDFEWRWDARNATRIALHLKQDVHREVDAINSPSERSEDLSYAVAIEHVYRLTDTVTVTPGYSYTVQDGQEADNAVNGVLVPFDTSRADAHNGQLVVNWTATDNGTLTAGVSRKTRFPTIKDRFSFRLGAAIPNPALGPEAALQYELDWTQRWNSVELRAALFQSDLDDAIENVTVARGLCTAPNPNCFQQRNVGKQRNRGGELALGWAPTAQWKFDAQASLLDRDNRSSPNIRPINTPEQKYRLAARWQQQRILSLRADLQHETKRYSTTDSSRVAEHFTIVNSFIRLEPVPKLGFEFGVRNLFDELYAYEEGFFEAGRTWLAQVDYRY
ncbi:TonB-dependent receptor plug domain-containing protein [Nevskia ramosa]|uniref:TonB-dependent receptor plug domain-containing protein n=1 Tax=Nevskia ramosa TaxID=64002 RepID=UPI003D1497EC